MIADAILKGMGGFDYRKAFEAMKTTANQDIRESDHYRLYGYVPDDKDPRQRGVTKTVEYAYDDWCIAQVAKKLSFKGDYLEFMKRSGYWKNLFDPATGFVRPKDSDGNWMLPFNPAESIGFQEGNAWIYTWYVLSSIGFYPVNPASGEYVLGSPLAAQSTLNFDDGKHFTIHANGLSRQKIYIQKATLNGKPYTKSFLRHSDILKGGELVLYMADQPSATWGVKMEDRPGKEGETWTTEERGDGETGKGRF